ncbi:acyl-CoA dehydrogenase family protein [Streptomyces yaizuensis]|uniref:Acyl-CoA dehydrogenase family protein n=1 Tax=Streptomyces yaizuensis TaxID=2989713 RepID=A0ABQ5P6C8_9ACTN|nr:acyl-CoA dehydrogenase family protein [Streptomyces sp. YSPA8]GLF98125.1 acyl-CoA dehydrogenase family protein [Streptomyces sp. YSPA8]
MDAYFLTKQHRILRERVRDFAEREVRPRVAEMEAERRVHHGLSRRIAQQGWLGATIPREYGGMGAGHVAKTVIVEELARASGAMGAMVQASQLGVAKLLHFGTGEQKRRWLPRVAAGEVLPTIAVTEHESGGHVAGMLATAVRDGDSYVLTGRKVYVGNSHVGDVHGVVARTGPGPRGLTAFLVENGQGGFAVAEQEPALGLHGFSFGELVFTGCRIPVENRIGREGEGLKVAYSSSILYGRANLTAVALGVHQAILEDTVRFCAERERYGRPLHEQPVVRDRIGRITSRLMTARLAAYHAVHLLDRGLDCDAELMNAKLIGVDSAVDSAREALEIQAAAGLLTSRPAGRHLRDVLHLFAPAGTSDVQRLRLAQMSMGLAGEPWSRQLSPAVRGVVRREQEETAVPA